VAAPVIVRVWDGSRSGQHRRLATSTGCSVMRANGLADGFRGVGADPRLGFLLRIRVPTSNGFGVLAAPLTIRSQTGEARLVIGSVARRDAGARFRGRDWLVERKPRP